MQTFPESQEAFPTAFPANHLRNEWAALQARFQAQTPPIRHFLETQAHTLVEALLQQAVHVRFHLPARVMLDGIALAVPPDIRKQTAGSWVDRLAHTSLLKALSQCLSDLEGSPSRAVSISASLARFSAARQMVSGILPSGHSVTYRAVEGEDLPSLPVWDGSLAYAQLFFLPQWVAFDQEDRLLAKTHGEAFAQIASLQRFFSILQLAAALEPYIAADEEFQRKRYGVLGQLVNQGRALARFEMEEVIRTIKQWAAGSRLNRGLSLSLPYFDDQALELKTHAFVVIPPGRIVFLPAFVVRAARQEQVIVAQDTRLSPSTRKHLLMNLRVLEQTFYQAA
jgi:hypothetical protein